ncbi:hypothetical protein ACIXNO_20140 [Bacteroides fragilis]
MTLLVSCDEYCFTYQGQHYLSERGQIFLKRYLEVFENVLLAVRTKVVETSEDLGHHSHIVDDERVKIVEIPFFQGPKQYLPLYFNVKKSAKNAVANCDIAILRLPSTTSL